MAISRRQFLGLSAAGAATLAVRPSIAVGDLEGWERGPSLPWPTQEVYCTTWNGQLFAIGGNTAAGIGASTSSIVETYALSEN